MRAHEHQMALITTECDAMQGMSEWGRKTMQFGQEQVQLPRRQNQRDDMSVEQTGLRHLFDTVTIILTLGARRPAVAERLAARQSQRRPPHAEQHGKV